MERVGKQISKIPLAVIPPPVITPSDMTVASLLTDVPIRAAVQITTPVIQRPVPIMIFNSDLP